MATHIVIDGNAFYEVDEECIRRMADKTKKMRVKTQENRRRGQMEAKKGTSQ